LLGSDAYNAAEKHTMQLSAADREWRDLSNSTDRSSRPDDEVSAAHKEGKR
jgi:hypothetical protein